MGLHQVSARLPDVHAIFAAGEQWLRQQLEQFVIVERVARQRCQVLRIDALKRVTRSAVVLLLDGPVDELVQAAQYLLLIVVVVTRVSSDQPFASAYLKRWKSVFAASRGMLSRFGISGSASSSSFHLSSVTSFIRGSPRKSIANCTTASASPRPFILCWRFRLAGRRNSCSNDGHATGIARGRIVGVGRLGRGNDRERCDGRRQRGDIGGYQLGHALGHCVLNESIDHGDRIEGVRPGWQSRVRLGHPAFFSCFIGLAAAGFVGTADVEPGDAGLGGLVLIDEVDPEGRHLRKAHRVGVAAFLRPREKASHLVLEGAALGQRAARRRRAATDIGPQPYVEHGSHGFQVGSLDQLLYPSEIVHQPAPRLIEIPSPQADTKKGEPKEPGSLFPQPISQEIATVAAPGEVGGTRHVAAFPEAAGVRHPGGM